MTSIGTPSRSVIRATRAFDTPTVGSATVKPRLTQVGNTGLDIVGLDADVRDARRLIGRYGQQLDERIAGHLQIREPHRAVRVANRKGFLGAERVAVERERVVVILRADADVVDAPPGAILGYAHLHDHRPHDQPGQKQH